MVDALQKARTGPKPTPTEERLWSHVDIDGPIHPVLGQCMEWRGKTNRGYGSVGIGSRSDGSRSAVYVHRFVYEAIYGPIAAGLTLDHLCRNTICVNPLHLEPVTPGENTLRGDAVSAINARKTHCHRGHPFDDANTLHYGGGRQCRVCARLKWTASNAKQRSRARVVCHR